MVYAFQLQATFATTQKRDSFLTAAQTYLTKPRWGTTISAATGGRSGEAMAVIEVRFIASADQVAAWDALLANVKTNSVTWTLVRHNCTHDEDHPVPCQIELTTSGP